MSESDIFFDYSFEWSDRPAARFTMTLNPHDLTLVQPDDIAPAPWTRLSKEQCACCPLAETDHPHCPVAVNLQDLVTAFKDRVSFDDCIVRCVTPQRTYLKNTAVMDGLASIFGIVMATSGCPIMDFLKPMARFHLPFASIEETTMRSTSMFLLRQYFSHRDDPTRCFNFEPLENHYSRVQEVNEGLLARINSLGHNDADKNALVTLHSLSQFLSIEIDYSLEALADLF
ncbi:MAG: hypothetical protein QNJ22_11030 [Desulfosarcinaceae bacterium]|nr:hypothetical protein [Desulfosarcinaceae bacterium]